ncbi:MAG: hypothetical protein GXO64_04855 [Candidatus Micrarchaeota archaeon]|nr:hypothetical protein [Candidatus Micrarchaeota archaeon]
MIKLKTCNICRKKFKATLEGRIEIVKRKDKGKVELWVCPSCAPQVKEKLKEIGLRV